MPLSTQDFLTAAKAQIKEVTPQEAKEMIASGAKVLDVRDPHEFDANAPIEAINISRGMLEFKIGTVAELEDRSQTIVLICGTGARSAMAAVTLQQMGYENVVSMAGGLKEWVSSGL